MFLFLYFLPFFAFLFTFLLSLIILLFPPSFRSFVPSLTRVSFTLYSLLSFPSSFPFSRSLPHSLLSFPPSLPSLVPSLTPLSRSLPHSLLSFLPSLPSLVPSLTPSSRSLPHSLLSFLPSLPSLVPSLTPLSRSLPSYLPLSFHLISTRVINCSSHSARPWHQCIWRYRLELSSTRATQHVPGITLQGETVLRCVTGATLVLGPAVVLILERYQLLQLLNTLIIIRT